MKSHAERTITIGFVVVLLFMTGIGAVSYQMTLRVEADTVERARTNQIRLDLGILLSQLQDIVAGERGYLITGDKGYLESYNATVSAASRSMTELRQLTADNPSEQQKLDELAALIQARLSKLQQTTALYQSQGLEAAASLIRADQGETIMGQIRQAIGNLQATEDTEYAQSAAALEASLQVTQKVILLSGLLTFVIIALAGVVIRRSLNERRQAEKRILRLNRLYATLSQINQTIVRVREPQALFESICRVAIEHGQFRMAWIGLIDETSGLVKPVAFAGQEQGHLKNISIEYEDESLGRGPVGTAIREERCIICQDIASDPLMGPWREPALQRGYRSLAAVPIRQQGRVIGALAVYSAETRGFDREDEKLLDEIGGDISFALDSIRTEGAYRTLVEHSLQGFMILQDGTGYPRALKGDQIPLSARIFAVIDVWDALTSDRVYRKAWSNEKAIDYIKSQAGIHFDPRVVKVCFESGVLERKNQT